MPALKTIFISKKMRGEIVAQLRFLGRTPRGRGPITLRKISRAVARATRSRCPETTREQSSMLLAFWRRCCRGPELRLEPQAQFRALTISREMRYAMARCAELRPESRP